MEEQEEVPQESEIHNSQTITNLKKNQEMKQTEGNTICSV